MRINRRRIDKEASGTGIELDEEFFRIGDVSVILGILRSGIYSDPIKTVIQEIGTNARDAHRELDKGHVPIEVSLPTITDPYLRIRDFGPGVSPQRMKDTFIAYGCTTKSDDQDQTGGLGLGCKSPWAYSDWFEIDVVQPGLDTMMRRTYRAFIDESRVGKLVLKDHCEAPNEEQGTTIIVPVLENDFSSFRLAASRLFRWWNCPNSVIPNVTEMDTKGNEVDVEINDALTNERYFEGSNWHMEAYISDYRSRGLSLTAFLIR